jgi:hypothetical protein
MTNLFTFTLTLPPYGNAHASVPSLRAAQALVPMCRILWLHLLKNPDAAQLLQGEAGSEPAAMINSLPAIFKQLPKRSLAHERGRRSAAYSS